MDKLSGQDTFLRWVHEQCTHTMTNENPENKKGGMDV